MQCPQCQQDNPPPAKFCLVRTRLVLTCAQCGTELPTGAKKLAALLRGESGNRGTWCSTGPSSLKTCI